jgi:hypothetical protein
MKGTGCEDHVFTLNSILQYHLQNKRNVMFAIFIDLSSCSATYFLFIDFSSSGTSYLLFKEFSSSSTTYLLFIDCSSSGTSYLLFKEFSSSSTTYLLFIDFSKAFDSSRQVLKSIYSKANTRVRTETGVSDSFSIERGILQGEALSPKLFTIMIDELVDILHRPETPTFQIMSREVHLLLYADDMLILATNAFDLKKKINCRIFGYQRIFC